MGVGCLPANLPGSGGRWLRRNPVGPVTSQFRASLPAGSRVEDPPGKWKSSAGTCSSVTAGLDFGGEGTPLSGSEGEGGTAGVLAVADGDDAGQAVRDFDAFGLPVAVAALAPCGAGVLVGAHWRSSSAAWWIRSLEAGSSRAAFQMLSNAPAYRSTSRGLSR